MIAHDTGHIYVDEGEIHCDSAYALAALLRGRGEENLVIQCPALLYALFCAPASAAVVMMKRNLPDIWASEARIGWKKVWEATERLHYDQWAWDRPYYHSVAELKYDFWECIKPTVGNSFEVEYESLSEHPLWVPKERRREFAFNQTEEGDGREG